MNHPTLTITRKCAAEVLPRRLVVLDSNDDTGESVAVATGHDTRIYGVSDLLGGEAGGRVDVVVAGFSLCELGDTVALNDPLTSDSEGRAVPAPASVADQHIIGWASEAGEIEEYRSVHLAQARLP